MNEHYVKGLEQCKNEQYEEAISSFNRSLLMNPMHLEGLYNRGMAKFRLERYLDAIQDFDEALKVAPTNADIFSQRGVAKHLMGNTQAALKDLDQALALEPQNAYRYSSRAFIRANFGDVFGAQEDYKKALELDPEDAVAWNNLGLLEEKIGYKESAQERFKKADGIADKDQTFEKPSLDKVLEDNKSTGTPKQKIEVSKPITKAETEKQKGEGDSLQQQTVTTEQVPANPSTKDYIRVVKEVFTSKEVFKDFLQFMKGKFFGSKEK